MSNMIRTLVMRKFSQRKIAPNMVINTPNGIVEEQFIPIGGIEQWISIRGENRHNPVLLIVHGGPGSTYGVLSPLLRSWEKCFTVVQWDQRGAGHTFRKNSKKGSGKLTFERLVDDGIEVSEYLKTHLCQEKIILIGSSVGSVIGVMMAHNRPDLFYVYVGTEQVSPDGYALAYQMTLDGYRNAGNTKAVREVERIGSHFATLSRKDFDRMNKLTVSANRQVPHMITDVMLPAMLTAPGYSLRDLSDIIRGINFSLDQLFDELMAVDLLNLGLNFNLPFFIFQGEGDWLAPPVAAQAYLDRINAPCKAMVLIQGAGHLAMFANPGQFLHELLHRVRPLAVATPNP
ncbi:MAG: alpha/beta hydrolase [Chloroflexota bacterium]